MLRTIIDQVVLLEFYKEYSNHLTLTSPIEETEFITSFVKFIKKESNLHIFNISNEDIFLNSYLNDLTHGRGDSSLTHSYRPFISFENYCTQKSSPKNCYFVNIIDKIQRETLKSTSGHFVAFLEEYKKKYLGLSMLDRPTKLLVRNIKSKNSFIGWNDLTKYLLPFTDIIYIDNYIFRYPELHKNNLIPLLCTIDRATPVKYNLLFITYDDTNYPNPEKIKNLLLTIKRDHRLKFELGIYIAGKELHEHDRGIFMNYMRIKSGDSFIYFNEDGTLRTHGTEIEFCPYTDSVNSVNATDILRSIKIKFRLSQPTSKRFSGSKINNLIPE